MIALVGTFAPSRAGSELAKCRGEEIAGPLPLLDERAARDAHETVRQLVNSGALHNAHDIAEGGIAVAIAECCAAGGVGATVRLPDGVIDPFAEAPGRAFVVSGPESVLSGWPVIGRVGGQTCELQGWFEVSVSELREARGRGLEDFL